MGSMARGSGMPTQGYKDGCRSQGANIQLLCPLQQGQSNLQTNCMNEHHP